MPLTHRIGTPEAAVESRALWNRLQDLTALASAHPRSVDIPRSHHSYANEDLRCSSAVAGDAPLPLFVLAIDSY